MERKSFRIASYSSALQEKEKSLIEQCLSRTSVITRFGPVPLGSSLAALVTTLHRHGYALDSLRLDARAGSTTSFHPAPMPQRTRKRTRHCQLHEKIAHNKYNT